jgi:uncharacterized protein
MRIRGLVAACCLTLLAVAGFAAAGSDLADAVTSKNKAAVRSLLQQKADVNAPQADGTTALMWSVRWDDLETTDLLLKAGANVNAANRNGVTAMYLATLNGSSAMVDRLIKAGADVNAKLLTHGESALMMAAKTGNAEVVKMLLDKGADVNTKETLRDTTALMWAASQNHADVIKLLVGRGADVKLTSKVDHLAPKGGVDKQLMQGLPAAGGLPALVFAAREGAIDAVKALVAAGASANQTSADGSSPMLVAIQNGHYNIAEFLLNSGANPNIANEKGWSPLYLTVKNRNIETGTIPVPNTDQAFPFLLKLLAKGVDPNIRSKANTEIRNGQRATWFNEAGATPFIRAALCGDVEVMKLLLIQGADPNIATLDGTTPLMAAAGVGYSEGFIHDRSEEETLQAMKLILDLGADVNAKNAQGLTALHGAAHKAALGEIQLLVDHGADLMARDKPGNTRYGDATEGLLPLDWAEGVTVGVQSAIYHEDAVNLITKLMKERGLSLPDTKRTKGGNAKVGNTEAVKR